VRLAPALALVAALACAPPPPPAPLPEDALLRARVARLTSDPEARVFGAQIASRRALPALYERRGFRRAWTSAAARDDLLRAIRDSAADGLEPEDYLLTPLERARAEVEAGAGLEASLDYDLLQTEALIRLLYHLTFGKVDPKSLDPNWNLTRRVRSSEPGAFLDELIESGQVYARIDAQKPRHELYQRLRAELERQRQVARAGVPAPPVPEGEKLELGARGPRVAALRARLGVEGDSDAFDASLAEAVRFFQESHGLDVDGTVGAETLAALNQTSEALIAQIRVNLERGRWYLHDLDATFVVVNLAGFRAYYLRDGAIAWSGRAIIGKPFRETPTFRARMTHLVLNPTWTVPPTILDEDMLPEQRRDPTYLERKGLQLLDRSGKAVPAASIDWTTQSAKTLPVDVVQGPGPENPLGRIKFMFPNEHAVYLHDTPSRGLFEKSERTFSSGCIRIERPLELAELLLQEQPGWDRAALDAALATGETRTVVLDRKVPVLIAYWTAWVDANGVLQTRRDVYGRDPGVLRGLDAPFAFRR
jgi:murein L,D-transpeptidase YcbB/YkuD